MHTAGDLRAAIIEGAVERVRPKLMTVATTLIGLMPVMFAIETGSQVMKRNGGRPGVFHYTYARDHTGCL